MAKKIVHLPQELIIEILLRLPVKTLLLCMSVCKSWLSLISNPGFATSHFQLDASPKRRLVFLETNNYKFLSIDLDASFNDDSAHATLNFDFLRHRYYPGIVGSCRGFLFLDCYHDFYMWNPSTGVHKQIPPSPITIASQDSSSLIMYGFGYDPSRDDYLLILGYYDIHVNFELEIFTLRDNKWKQIRGDSHFPYVTNVNYEYDSRIGLLLNEIIHWLVFNYEASSHVIIAFDLKERKMSEIALPYDVGDTHYPQTYGLSVLGGLIGTWIVEMHTVTIWVMQKYAVHSSWTKIIEFSIDTVMHYSLSIVCITNCGDIIVTDGRGGLMKFNDKGQLLEHHLCGKGVHSVRTQMAVYTESLLSLPYGTEQA